MMSNTEKEKEITMPRIFVVVSKEIESELEEYRKEKGLLKVQDAVRDVLGEWYAQRRKEEK